MVDDGTFKFVGSGPETVMFDVIGIPAPQGSKSAFVRNNRAVVVDGSSASGRAKHAAWRSAVAQRADAVRGVTSFSGPVRVKICFYLPLPSSSPHRVLHSSRPDLDKLIRSVLDSLTDSGLIRDDALVSEIWAEKLYARDGHWTGASIQVVDRSDEEEQLGRISRNQARLAPRKKNLK